MGWIRDLLGRAVQKTTLLETFSLFWSAPFAKRKNRFLMKAIALTGGLTDTVVENHFWNRKTYVWIYIWFDLWCSILSFTASLNFAWRWFIFWYDQIIFHHNWLLFLKEVVLGSILLRWGVSLLNPNSSIRNVRTASFFNQSKHVFWMHSHNLKGETVFWKHFEFVKLFCQKSRNLFILSWS